jgi:hypothetical protein
MSCWKLFGLNGDYWNRLYGSNQGCQIFLDAIYQRKYTKLLFNHQMAIKRTKWPYYIQKGQRLYQPFLLLGPLKFTQISIFGLKRNHLATLVLTRSFGFTWWCLVSLSRQKVFFAGEIELDPRHPERGATQRLHQVQVPYLLLAQSEIICYFGFQGGRISL